MMTYEVSNKRRCHRVLISQLQCWWIGGTREAGILWFVEWRPTSVYRICSRYTNFLFYRRDPLLGSCEFTVNL